VKLQISVAFFSVNTEKEANYFNRYWHFLMVFTGGSYYFRYWHVRKTWHGWSYSTAVVMGVSEVSDFALTFDH
jgi:hypothetical protein